MSVLKCSDKQLKIYLFQSSHENHKDHVKYLLHRPESSPSSCFARSNS